MPHEPDLAEPLRRWDFHDPTLELLRGGWNAMVWRLRSAAGTYIVKLADLADETAFLHGLRVAEALAKIGFASGRPTRTSDGELAVRTDLGVLAVLAEVPGRPADPSSGDDMDHMGRILAAAHRALDEVALELAAGNRWPWGWPAGALSAFDAPPAVVNPVAATLAAAEAAADRLSQGFLHGDPAPDSFRIHQRLTPGGLIDWATVLGGPRLYDLASVWVLAGGRSEAAFERFLSSYLRAGLVRREELTLLPTFVRLRWAAHAVYFWSRLARGIVRGGDERANQEGLRRALAGMQVSGADAAGHLHLGDRRRHHQDLVW